MIKLSILVESLWLSLRYTGGDRGEASWQSGMQFGSSHTVYDDWAGLTVCVDRDKF